MLLQVKYPGARMFTLRAHNGLCSQTKLDFSKTLQQLQIKREETQRNGQMPQVLVRSGFHFSCVGR